MAISLFTSITRPGATIETIRPRQLASTSEKCVRLQTRSPRLVSHKYLRGFTAVARCMSYIPPRGTEVYMARTVADQFVETLAAAGVKRIYGIVGDSLNGITDAIRRHGKIDWVHVRIEEVAPFAAGAEAHLTGELA